MLNSRFTFLACSALALLSTGCSLSHLPLAPASVSNPEINTYRPAAPGDFNPHPNVSVASLTPAVSVGAVIGTSATERITLTNNGTATLNIASITLGSTSSQLNYNALGDSITLGVGLNNVAGDRYPQLVANTASGSLTDMAYSGHAACDEFPLQISANSVSPHLNDGTFYTNIIGTNDITTQTVNFYKHTFKLCNLAALGWLATPRESKVLAGDSAMTGTANWPSTANSANFNAATATGAGTLTATLATTGAPIYGWYIIDDSSNACFNVSVDSGTVTTVCAQPPVPIATTYSTRSVGMFRLPVAAGTHTIAAVTVIGGVSILGFGSLPATTSLGQPLVLSGDVPNQASPETPTLTALLAQYNSWVAADEAVLVGDGAHIFHVPDAQYMLGGPSEMDDAIHPNALGHQHLANAFNAILPMVTTATPLFSNTTTCGSTLAAGAFCKIFVTFTPAIASTIYSNTVTVISDSGGVSGTTQTSAITGNASSPTP